MNKKEAIVKYEKLIDPWTLWQYQDADKSFTINNDDPDLKPITIYLPQPPDWELIEGFGKEPCDQKFTKVRMPPRLIELERKVTNDLRFSRTVQKNEALTKQKIIDEIWVQLDKRQRDYEDEIIFIKKQWYHLLNGYWCFINGKPTYINNWHYRYLNFWSMECEVEYRDRSRRWFLAHQYAYETREDENGRDTGHRTFFGTAYPKHRRDGATHSTLSIGYDIITKALGAVGAGIQSFDDDNAGSHYKEKLIPAFKVMPFYLKPAWKGSQAPQRELHFSRIDNSIGDELGTKFDYATTSYRKYYDGKKLLFIDLEEEGKTLSESISERWNVIRHCLGQGNGAAIEGFACHPTTVADMVEGGGRNFYVLCESSEFYKRNVKTGQTESGLMRIFIPAYDGLEGYIGPFGESVIDEPSEEQKEFIRRDIGAREHIQSQKDVLLNKGDPDSMASYRALVRQFPIRYMDCFRTLGGEVGFDIEKLDAAIERLEREDRDELSRPTTCGDYKWRDAKDGQIYSAKEYLDRFGKGRNQRASDFEAVWMPNKEGRWKISRMPPKNEQNKFFIEDGERYPMYPGKNTGSADPFNFLKNVDAEKREDKNRLSKGGCAFFWERDLSVDPPDKDISEWESYRFTSTYNTRPDTDDEFAEECLIATVFHSCEMFPEVNIRLIPKHFSNRGYWGYLKYEIDEETGKRKEQPGFYSKEGKKQDIWNAMKRYIYHHSKREKHIDILVQCRRIKGIEYMTDFDLFTAAGGCLLGSGIVDYEKNSEPEEAKVDMGDVFPMYNYR